MAAKKTTPTEEVKTAKTPAAEAKPVEAKPVEAKPVEAKPVEKKTAEKKPAAAKKTAAKKTAAKKPAAKKAEPKAAPDINEITELIRKKIAKKDVSKINEKIAVSVKVYGEYEDYLYILVEDGTVDVQPYGYIGPDVHIDLPIDDALAIIKGNYDYKAKILSGDFYAVGALTKLLKIKEALF